MIMGGLGMVTAGAAWSAGLHDSKPHLHFDNYLRRAVLVIPNPPCPTWSRHCHWMLYVNRVNGPDRTNGRSGHAGRCRYRSSTAGTTRPTAHQYRLVLQLDLRDRYPVPDRLLPVPNDDDHDHHHHDRPSRTAPRAARRPRRQPHRRLPRRVRRRPPPTSRSPAPRPSTRPLPPQRRRMPPRAPPSPSPAWIYDPSSSSGRC